MILSASCTQPSINGKSLNLCSGWSGGEVSHITPLKSLCASCDGLIKLTLKPLEARIGHQSSWAARIAGLHCRLVHVTIELVVQHLILALSICIVHNTQCCCITHTNLILYPLVPGGRVNYKTTWFDKKIESRLKSWIKIFGIIRNLYSMKHSFERIFVECVEYPMKDAHYFIALENIYPNFAHDPLYTLPGSNPRD